MQQQLHGEGEAPSLRSRAGWLGLQVSGSLQEAAARPGRFCLPSLAQEGTRSCAEEAEAAGQREGKGPVVPPQRQSPAERASEPRTKATHRSSAYRNIVYLQAGKPFVFKSSFWLGGD